MNQEERQLERRVFDFSEHPDLAPRIDGSDDSRVIIGYAIVFNQNSRVLYDKASRSAFTEVIERGAVNIDFLNAQDIKLNFNHNNDHILGRSMAGHGTLSYEIDDYGVRFRCELPNTSVGNDVLEMIRRGDVSGCSFAFTYAKDGFRDEKKGGEKYRTVTRFGSIDDFAIVVDPAYWGTFVCTRAFQEPSAADDKPAGMPAGQRMELLRLQGIL